MEEPKKQKFFYGWVIVFVGFIITFIGLGSIGPVAGVLIVPICEELGFSRAEFTFHRTIFTLVGALLLPLYGKLFHRIGIKKVLIISTVSIAVLTFSYSFATNIWHFYLIAFLNGLFVSGPNLMTVGYLINNWFQDKRGLATGITFAGGGAGGAFFIPIVARIVEFYGWRMAYRFTGIVLIAVLLPIIILLLKDRPEDMGLEPYTDKNKTDKKKNEIVSKNELCLNQAIKTPTFWMLLLAFFLLTILGGGAHTNTVPYLIDIGFYAIFAATVLSTLSLMHTVGNLALGSIFDRFGVLIGGIFLGLCCIVFPIMALNAGVPGFVWLFALFFGPASAGFVPITFFVIAYFGRKDFAIIYSIFNMAGQVSLAVSGPSMALVYDLTGSYHWAWIMLMVFGVVIMACFVGSHFINRRQKAGLG